MNGPEVVFLFFMVRLIIPFGLLLLLGEWARRRAGKHAHSSHRHSHSRHR